MNFQRVHCLDLGRQIVIPDSHPRDGQHEAGAVLVTGPCLALNGNAFWRIEVFTVLATFY